MMTITLMYVPFGDQKEARDVAQTLIAEKLIACANIVASESLFLWEGTMSKENEWVAILKTLPEVSAKVIERIKELHSYDIPAILSWNVMTNESYKHWVVDQIENEI